MWSEKTDNGKIKYRESYYHPLTGKEKKVSTTFDKDTASNRKLALTILTKKIEKRCTAVTFKDITLTQLVDKYREYQKTTVKGSTYDRNFHACNALMKMLGKDILISRITAPYVKSKFRATKKKGSTLNEHRKRFKALINWAFEEDLLQDISFLKKIKPFHEKVTKKMRIQDKFLESREVKKLLEQMRAEEKYTWAYLAEMMVLSGWRSGEAIAISEKSVNFKSRIVKICEIVDANTNVLSEIPKTEASIRETYMQDDLLILMRKIKIYVKEERFREQYKNEHKIFLPSAKGEHLKYASFNNYLKSAAERAGIKKVVTTHVLRHTHCSLMFEQGVDLEVIARRLGHANSRVTKDIYLHITEKMKEKDNQAVKAVHLV